MLHWTGSDNPLETFMGTLSRRGLSVHDFLDRDGTIHRLEDGATTVCLHGNWTNPFSVGLEIRNPGTSSINRLNRPRFDAVIKGHRVRPTRFTPEQLVALVEWCEDVCARYGLPRQYVAGMDLVPRDRLKAFRGICGHVHAYGRKLDPGPEPFEELAAAGFVAVAL